LGILGPANFLDTPMEPRTSSIGPAPLNESASSSNGVQGLSSFSTSGEPPPNILAPRSPAPKRPSVAAIGLAPGILPILDPASRTVASNHPGHVFVSTMRAAFPNLRCPFFSAGRRLDDALEAAFPSAFAIAFCAILTYPSLYMLS